MKIVSCFIFFLFILGANAQVVINEVHPIPSGGSTDNCIQAMYNTANPACGTEWIELYNTSSCEAVDLSCFILSGRTSSTNRGVFVIPQGTVIPPLGFLTIGGGASGADLQIPAFLNQGLTCGGSRWFLENTTGWIALYSPQGVPVNAVYWTFNANDPGALNSNSSLTGGGADCVPTNACGASAPLQGINQMPAAVVSYAGQVPAAGQSKSRTSDGATTWQSAASTFGTCNAACISSNTFQLNAQVSQVTCAQNDGQIGFNPSPASNYTYTWSPSVSTSASASNLSPGTYQVTISDGTCQKDTSIVLLAPDCGCTNPLTLTITAVANNSCSPNTNDPCAYTGPLLVINELLIQPNGTNTLWSPFGVGSEWIELYNPHPCEPIDISCYVLGANGFVAGQAGSSAYGTIVIPQGTILPPLSTYTIGGSGITPSLSLSNTDVRCGNVNGQNAFQLDNTQGHLLLFEPTGQFVDGVYWGPNAGILSAADFQLPLACLPSNAATCGVNSLAVFSPPATLLNNQYYLGTVASNRVYFRNENLAWTSTIGAGTPNACNVPGTCVPPTTEACNGSATVSVTGGVAPFTYVWNDANAQTGATASGLCEGTYCVTVTDATGECVESICVDVESEGEIIVNSNVTNPSCNQSNGSIDLIPSTTGNYIYTWSPNVSTTNTAQNLAAGTYQVVVNSGSCSSELTFVLNSSDGPTDIIYSLQQPSCSTNDGSIEITSVLGGNAPYTYSLNGDAYGSQTTFSDLASGEYSISVADVNNCIFQVNSILLENTGGIESIQYVSTNASCLGNLGTISVNSVTGGNAPYTYTINGITTTNGQFENLTAGIYSLEITDASNCTFIQQIQINQEPSPIANFIASSYLITGSQQVIFTNESSSDVVNWTWIAPNGNPSSGQSIEFSTFFSDLPEGEYPVTLFVENVFGCRDSITQFIQVLEPILFYAPNTFTPDGDEFNNTWNISCFDCNPADYSLRIYNRWGQLIFESNDLSIGWDGTYNGFITKTDLYVWKVRLSDKNTDKKYEFKGHVYLLK